MNEPKKSIWKKSLPAKFAYLLLFMVVVCLAFYVLLFLNTSADWAKDLKPATFALIVATGVGITALLSFLFLRWLRVWRNMRRFLFVVACLITSLALLITEENVRGRHDWEKHRHALEAKGESFSLAQLAPPTVPDDKNLAFTPLLRPIFDFNETSNNTRWQYEEENIPRRDANAYLHLRGFSIFLKMPDGTNSAPELGNPVKGTYVDLAAWQNFFHGNTNYPQPAATGTPAADILFALGQFDADIADLREAATNRPYCRFPLAYDIEPAVIILLPHLSHLKGFACFFGLRAVAEMEQGQGDEAFTDLKLALRFADSVRDEPMLISHMVRIALLNINLQTVREGLARHAWTDTQLTELDHYLAALNLLAEWKHSMRGERAFVAVSADYMRRRGFTDFNTGGGSRPLVSRVLSVAISGQFFQNMLTASELAEEYVYPSVDENARRVFPDKCVAVEELVQAAHDHPLRHPHTILAAMTLPAVSRSSARTAQMQSRVDEARIAIALERYHRANGHLPDSLDPLVPQFLDKIPTDVMGGQPLRYHKIGNDKYIVYSIGWNLKDDGGVIGRKPEHKGIDTLSGDWVWFSYPNDFRVE